MASFFFIVLMLDRSRAQKKDFSGGTRELWREDATDFPEEALGNPLEDWDGEVWVDVNNEVCM